MSNLPPLPPERAGWNVARVLQWHLDQGTRPAESRIPNGEHWTKSEFAAALGCDIKNIENWLGGRIPQEKWVKEILKVLFGHQFGPYRAELIHKCRVARGTAAEADPPGLAPTAEPAGSAQEAPLLPPRAFSPDVPASTLHFVGREDELSDIHASLQRAIPSGQTQGPVRVALSGMGGIGKTSLAATYVRRFGGEYGGIGWCNAESPQTLRTSLTHLHKALPSGTLEHPDINEAAKSALALIAAQPRPWLLVYDNAPSPDAVRELLPADHVPLLITSRSPFWSNWAVPVPVHVLPLDKALELLRDRAPNVNQECNEHLAERLGRLPLALDHAAAFCEHSRITLADYAAKVDALIVARPNDSNYPTSVAVTFEIAISEAERQLPAVSELTAFLAQCAAERIPMTLIEAAVRDDVARFQAVALLAAMSLIRHDPFPDGTPAVTLHHLVQRIAWSRSIQMGTAEPAQQRLFSRLSELYPEPDLIFSDNACWELCDRLTPHVFSWLARPETEGPSSAKLAELIARAGPTLTRAPRLGRLRYRVLKLLRLTKPEELLWPNLMQLAGHYLYARTSYADAAEVWRGVVELWKRLFGRFHRVTGSALTNLGQVLGDLGDFSGAEACLQSALEIHEKTIGRDHLDTAGTLDHLGTIARRQGRLSSASEYHERALGIRRKCLGETHPDIATSLNYLAMNAHEQGDISSARALIEKALSIRQAAVGPDDFESTMLLGGLGAMCQEQGDFQGAESLHRRVLAATEARLKIDHPNVATDLNNLARAIQAQGDYDRARPLFERALAIREKVYGPDHHDTALSLHNLGGLYADEGNLVKARQLFERALDARENALGSDHPDVGSTLYVLADLLCQQGDYANAWALHERALTIREKAYGPTHPSVAASLVGLVRVRSEQGDYASARPLAERALSVSARVYGEHDEHTAACKGHLARLLYHEGRRDEASAMFAQALDSFEKTFGRDHLYTVTARGDLAKIFGEQGDLETASTLYEDAISSLSETKGQDHPYVAALLNNFGELLRAHRKFAEAHVHLDRALTMTENTLGPDHPDTNRTRCNLARLLFDQGRAMEALPLARTSLDKLEDRLGDSHPQTIVAAEVLLGILDELRMLEESAKLRAQYQL